MMTDIKKDEIRDIPTLEQQTIKMLELTQVMFRTSFDGLMKNDIPTLDQVLRDDSKITEWYNNLTAATVEISK